MIVPLPQAKRKFIADQRVKRLSARAIRKLSAALHNSAKILSDTERETDIDPVSFARAFVPFREDMRLLSEQEQREFQYALQLYLSGALDSEEWRKIVSRLSELRRAKAMP